MWRGHRVGETGKTTGVTAARSKSPRRDLPPIDSSFDEDGVVAEVSGIGKRRSAAKEDSSASYQARKQEIADAAVRVFNRLGFQRASISAVAAELDIDRASLYYYISSKEELFDEIVRKVVESNLDTAKAIEASSATPGEKIHGLIIALMKSYADSYPLIYIYIRENLSHVSNTRSDWSRYMRGLNTQMTDLIIAIIEQGYADGSFCKVGPSRVVAYGILGIVGWTHRWFRPEKSDVAADDIGKAYADLVLGGLVANR